MSFDTTNIFKIYETPTSQIYRFATPPGGPIPREVLDAAVIDFECPNCKTKTKIQANLKEGVPTEKDAVQFPRDNKFICPACKSNIDLSGLRRQIESQSKKKIV